MTIFSINSGSFGDVTVTGIVSASTLKGDGSQITSVSYDNIASKPTLISSSTQVEALLPGGTLSSSAQVDITNTTGYSTFSGSLATIDTTQTSRLTAIENVTGSYATTGSNIFVGTQSFNDTTNTTSYLDGAIHVAGGMSVRKDVRISGSMTINGLLTAVSMSTQYVTSSEYNVGVSKITLNDDDTVRFAGISIYDSGSSSPTSASIYWDSLQHRFIYENLSGSAYNSSIIIAGPKHTGSLGDEPTLTSGYITVATGTDHIDNSVMFQSSSNIGIGTTNPIQTLDIRANSSTTYSNGVTGNGMFIYNPSTTTNQYVGITFQGEPTAGNAGVATIYGITTSTGTMDLAFSTRESATLSEKVRIKGTGAVGIGTTNPTALLHLRSAAPFIFFDDTTTNGTLSRTKIKVGDVGVNQSMTFGFDNTSDSSAVDVLTINELGKVGIGTNDPAEALTVASGGAIAVFRSDNTRAGYLYTDNFATILQSNTANSDPLRLSSLGTSGRIEFYVNSSERVRIDSSGNVGIGTTNPVARLRVFTDSADTQVRIGNNAAYDQFIYFNGTADWAMGIDNSNANAFKISRYSGLGTNDVITISTGSNVGIGTTNPRTALNVAAAATIDTAGADNKWTLRLQDTTSATTNVGGSILFQGYKTTTSAIGNFAGIAGLKENSTGGNENGYLAFYTTPNATGLLNERMRIDSSGNVGIGTTSPTQKLTVAGVTRSYYGMQLYDASTNAGGLYQNLIIAGGSDNSPTLFAETGLGLHFATNGSGTTRMYIGSNGNVGIGTANPAYRLVVSNAGGIGGEFDANGTIFAGGFGIQAYNRSTSVYVPFALYGSSIILGGGNVGIGTTDPTGRTHIQSTGITAAAISTGWPHYAADTAAQSKLVLNLTAGGNGSVGTAGQGASAVLQLGEYFDARGIITMSGAGGASPSDGGTGYGKDLMVKAGNSDNGNGNVGGRLFLAGGSGYNGGAYGTNYGAVILQPQGGNVGIGATPSAPLHVKSANNEIMRLQSSDATVGSLYFTFYDSADSEKGYLGYGASGNDDFYIVNRENAGIVFYNNGDERARITSGGDFLVAKTANNNDVGIVLAKDGYGYFTRNGETALFANRLTDDGNVIAIRQDSVTEGTISVSGNTVSYNAFAGSHWSQLEDGSKPEILRGTVMEALDELCEWPGEQNERLPKAKVSDTAGSKKVYGVFMAWDNDWTITNDMLITSLGAFVCRVSADVVVEQGDLLESNGDGTARVQADDVIRSSTIGKVTSTVKTHEYEDGTYCVPIVLYCG